MIYINFIKLDSELEKERKFFIINYYCGILVRKRLQFMYSECIEHVFPAWIRDNLGRLSYCFLGERCRYITSVMFRWMTSQKLSLQILILMYCLVMFSAFLNTVFRIAEKITKQYSFIIFAGFGFLESYGCNIAVASIS